LKKGIFEPLTDGNKRESGGSYICAFFLGCPPTKKIMQGKILRQNPSAWVSDPRKKFSLLYIAESFCENWFGGKRLRLKGLRKTLTLQQSRKERENGMKYFCELL